jgi:Tol biopolymer transport system component
VAEACVGSLYLIDVRARKRITLSDGVGIFVRPMAWSPDGRKLAFSVQPDSTRVAELWLVNADGSSTHRLWRDEQARAFEWLTWMPDGQTLLFINNPGGTSFGPGYVYMVISVSGGPPKELFANGESLDLFDNGNKILISRSVKDAGDWIVELAQ